MSMLHAGTWHDQLFPMGLFQKSEVYSFQQTNKKHSDGKHCEGSLHSHHSLKPKCSTLNSQHSPFTARVTLLSSVSAGTNLRNSKFILILA